MVKIKFSNLMVGYDVVVVGGSAAGTSFLESIDSKKYNVLLVDYKKLPHFKPCSGILVSNAKEHLASKDFPKKVLAKPENLHLTYLDWTTGKENKTKKHFVNTRRTNLDAWLFSEIKQKEGISISEETKLVDFFYTADNKFIVLILECNGQTKSVVTKYLVGCDGAMSMVRKKLYPREIPYYVAMQEVIPNFTLGEAYFIFDEEITDFYGWLIPKAKGVEVGIAVPPAKSKALFEKFKKKVATKFGITGQGILQSAIVLRPESIKDIFLGKGAILVCGEAAGLISPSSAEGISFALISGKVGAEAINRCSKNPLKEYTKKCTHLIDRLNLKFEKSKKIKSAGKRKTLFE